ncbi:leukocyte elastase inhibitor-like isoform X2 [Daktulosphaira vitifoliae]|uniref:leukocyte elastase inhibitor-like isoform X2 n=1 Tax=Daktulosphaira vitifoliae TaxID=58002 RepID=UPI0021AA8F59|nr:leukocyte elastase inhibitor-like isoform X2 [Daktulosphaira vitifoliae]
MSNDQKNMPDVITNLDSLSLANYDFSLSLYSKFSKQDGNIIYSPFSIHVIMFMASVGAAGKTFDEIINTIYLTKDNHLLDAYKELLDNLNEHNVLKIATGMFIDNSFKVKQHYIDKTCKYLNSTMEKVNFKENPEHQREYINSWVENKTNGKIKDLFSAESINKDTALVLANAIHFKNGWKHKFSDTVDEPFYISKGNEINVKMMTLTKNVYYFHNEHLKYAALELPYDKNYYRMIILLPDAKDGIDSLENNLSNIKLSELSKKMTTYNVNVKLPRFKIEQSFDLENVLAELGCSSMFSREANFSEICDSPNDTLCVSKVVHKAFIDVDENGTEAAAATGMAIALNKCIMKQLDSVKFFANHPFVILILGKNNVPLFIGRIKRL